MSLCFLPFKPKLKKKNFDISVSGYDLVLNLVYTLRQRRNCLVLQQDDWIVIMNQLQLCIQMYYCL